MSSQLSLGGLELIGQTFSLQLIQWLAGRRSQTISDKLTPGQMVGGEGGGRGRGCVGGQ